ncbi:hypothetical protein pEaSNUABM42_00186 [Erwinia phage pEa_SNUABM_42]|nr:hypothetical protein pEaSNUABM43_00187 [Erwinia phage pEa_SNUABM_43]QVW55503.1 hypothetical protein pEaSNUABM42_00186 [Erwinia phage pEa_SNUABM_42]
MGKINYNFNVTFGAAILAEGVAGVPKSQWRLKFGKLLSESGIRSVASPYYDIRDLIPVSPCEDREGGAIILELNNNEYLRQLESHYAKMLTAAYNTVDKKVSVHDMNARLTIRQHGRSLTDVVMELWVSGSVNDGHPQGVQPFTECFVFEASMRRDPYPTGTTEFGTDEERIPDVAERSINSPVYLVQAQNVKTTFGVTAKENPERIYIMARWAGWSEVKFYGGQVLLIAKLSIG